MNAQVFFHMFRGLPANQFKYVLYRHFLVLQWFFPMMYTCFYTSHAIYFDFSDQYHLHNVRQNPDEIPLILVGL